MNMRMDWTWHRSWQAFCNANGPALARLVWWVAFYVGQLHRWPADEAGGWRQGEVRPPLVSFGSVEADNRSVMVRRGAAADWFGVAWVVVSSVTLNSTLLVDNMTVTARVVSPVRAFKNTTNFVSLPRMICALRERERWEPCAFSPQGRLSIILRSSDNFVPFR